MNCSVKSINQATKQTINQSINETNDRLINQSINQSKEDLPFSQTFDSSPENSFSAATSEAVWMEESNSSSEKLEH
jgi:hypothetical protein